MSGNVKAVWVETKVNSSYVSSRCQDVRHAECGEFTAHDSTVLKSLEVRDPSAAWQSAVEAHQKRVREFASGTKWGGQPLTVEYVRTEVCAKVDNGRTILWISVYDKECQLQPLTEGNVIPEDATVAALFRGAQLTVALLGPVGSDAATATAKQKTPVSEPVKSGTQAVPGASPNKVPVVWPRNVPYDAMDVNCKPGRKC